MQGEGSIGGPEHCGSPGSNCSDWFAYSLGLVVFAFPLFPAPLRLGSRSNRRKRLVPLPQLRVLFGVWQVDRVGR